MPLFAFIAVSSVVVTPAGTAGRPGTGSVCAALSVVVVPFPFFTIERLVPSQPLSIAIWPFESAVTVVPFTVYVPLAVRPPSFSAAKSMAAAGVASAVAVNASTATCTGAEANALDVAFTRT
ncbi:hypothetical protein D3C80_1614900 [compost metagenome]